MVIEGDSIVIDLLKRTSAILEGHFILSSGLHSDTYVQCARLFQYPAIAEMVARRLVNLFDFDNIDVVSGAALGAVVLIQEVARVLGARAVFFEREEGKLKLRRGFEIWKGERVLVVEDVITTGGSVREVVEKVVDFGGKVVGVGSVVKRGSEKVKLPAVKHLKFLVSVNVSAWNSEECPLCRQNVPPVKPGSRNLNRL